jgi:hypothetical protein
VEASGKYKQKQVTAGGRTRDASYVAARELPRDLKLASPLTTTTTMPPNPDDDALHVWLVTNPSAIAPVRSRSTPIFFAL